MMSWQDYLEIAGVELFLRYRKRLMSPGITLEILRDQPGASLLDVAVRVHAGRQLLREGHDFDALAAIRSGNWATAGPEPGRAAQPQRRRDHLSRGMVAIGGLLFAGFCLLSLSDIAGGAVGLGAVVLAGVVAAGSGLYDRQVRDRVLRRGGETMPDQFPGLSS